MMNVFEPVRVKGKLFAKNVATGEFASAGSIRDVQLRNAETNNEVLMISGAGRVMRMPNPKGKPAVAATSNKMSFMSIVESRDPEVMFSN